MNKCPTLPEYHKLIALLAQQAQLQTEYGTNGIARPLVRAERALRTAIQERQALPPNRTIAATEPNDLKAIRALRTQASTHLGRLECGGLSRPSDRGFSGANGRLYVGRIGGVLADSEDGGTGGGERGSVRSD